MIGLWSNHGYVIVVIIICKNTDLNFNKTKYHGQDLVTLWIVNRQYKFKVRYLEYGYHVNLMGLFKP